MDHLESLRIFVAVADSGGFAKAARQRGASAPAVTRAIAALERRLGTPLLHRSTRSLRLTEAGEAFVADCRRILGELDDAEAAVSGQRDEPRGVLAVTAPALFGRRHIAPLLLQFLATQPALGVRSFFADRVVHLIDEGYDVALRIAHLPDSSLTALPVGHLRRVVVASPAYLQAHGVPRRPADLTLHQAIGFSFDGQGAQPWHFGDPREAGAPQQRLVVNAVELKVAAACAGFGLARALAYQVTDEVRDGRLQVVLEAHEPPPVPVHLVYPAGRMAAAKVRAFVGFAAERLRAVPVLQGRGLEAPAA
ncbi:LysR family transcriptional regulator [Aquincola sp. S2]|uniref:LysR family transcriptional regulator n=1 Tax=Pseudaquabacterium terrae TaxID=2732868 RepID=A0ABX2ENH5_9BURK|nr:LysR family transcriptional regulator [Aquabacterium terrae]NRF70123.1 LysR family transcriptional regulator [Aquabacterium terrae]